MSIAHWLLFAAAWLCAFTTIVIADYWRRRARFAEERVKDLMPAAMETYVRHGQVVFGPPVVASDGRRREP